ncbi:MAG TPA: hypothetical protein VFU23_07775 [Gemmatimonadales bacterium]|nr:hypothetical protein [Gemmatimonadales bacterium]
MRFPLISYVAAASQALPFAGLVRYGRALPAARRWVLVWASATLLSDAAGLWFASHGTRNVWTTYFTGPVTVAAALMALSIWQENTRVRRLFRLAIPALLVVLTMLVLLFEDLDSYSLVSGPFMSLVLVAGSLATLLGGVWQLEGSVLRQDWFWVGLGFALNYGSRAGLDPIARILAGSSMSTLVTISILGAWIDTIASLLIAGGMLCPLLPLRASSGRSSPASSPSPSS